MMCDEVERSPGIDQIIIFKKLVLGKHLLWKFTKVQALAHSTINSEVYACFPYKKVLQDLYVKPEGQFIVCFA